MALASHRCSLPSSRSLSWEEKSGTASVPFPCSPFPAIFLGKGKETGYYLFDFKFPYSRLTAFLHFSRGSYLGDSEVKYTKCLETIALLGPAGGYAHTWLRRENRATRYSHVICLRRYDSCTTSSSCFSHTLVSQILALCPNIPDLPHSCTSP